MFVSRGGGGGWFGDEGVVVLICPPNGVASLSVLRSGVLVWACWMNSAVLTASAACGFYGCGVHP